MKSWIFLMLLVGLEVSAVLNLWPLIKVWWYFHGSERREEPALGRSRRPADASVEGGSSE